MLEKILNTMIHGNTKTKIFLWTVFILGISAVFLVMAGVILAMPYLGLGGVLVGLSGLILSQSVSLNDLHRGRTGKKTPQKKKAHHEKSGSEKRQTGNTKEKEEAMPEEKTKKEREREKAQYLSSLNAKKVKKIMKEHKVNQIHVKVMIDSYPAKKIEQAPAFMWKTDTMLRFITLTGQAEEFEVPLEDIKNILLVKNVPADKEKDYRLFKYSSFISQMFQPYLPAYSEGTKDGELQVRKNTFRIEPGIYLTNSSVANLRKVLLPGVAFLVDDNVIASKQFNEYFKELYRHSLLCKNMVITLEEYREQIKKTLDALLEAPMNGNEIVNTIYDLNKYRLITKKDVVFYTQKYRELRM